MADPRSDTALREPDPRLNRPRFGPEPPNPEQILAARVVSWLHAQHWEVYEEVRVERRQGRIADIVALRGPILWVLECKRSLTMNALAQAHRWAALKRSVVVPESRTGDSSGRRFALEVCRRFDLGLVEVGRTGRVHERVPARIVRGHRHASVRLRAGLHPGQQRCAAAGSSRGGHWTPYAETMRAVRRIVAARPGCTMREILEALDRHHYGHDATARSCLARALREWESWCRVEEAWPHARYHVRPGFEPVADAEPRARLGSEPDSPPDEAIGTLFSGRPGRSSGPGR